MSYVNSAKSKALNLLLNETFSYTEETLHKKYVALASKNATQRKVSAKFFMYNGYIYPTKTNKGIASQTVRVTAPPLHCSLIQEFHNINHNNDNKNKNKIKNLFIEILTNSFNGIVLEEFLPTVLISILKQQLSPIEYNAINFGTIKDESIKSVEDTQKSIRYIYQYYGTTIKLLRDTLLERFLLQE